MVCSGSGEMTIPLIIGKLFDVIGPSGFLAISCILCFAAVGIYIAVILTGRGLIKKQNELGKQFSIQIKLRSNVLNKVNISLA